MKTKRIVMGFMAVALLMAGLAFTASPAKAETHFSFGVGVGPGYGYYAPPPVYYRPPYPGPGYYWTDGYYDPYGSWIAGVWAPRTYYARPYGYGRPFYGRGYYGGFRRDFDRDDFRGRGWGHRR